MLRGHPDGPRFRSGHRPAELPLAASARPQRGSGCPSPGTNRTFAICSHGWHLTAFATIDESIGLGRREEDRRRSRADETRASSFRLGNSLIRNIWVHSMAYMLG